jgi:hypothetical protein
MAWSYKIIGLSVLIVLSASLVQGEETNNIKNSWDDYKILSERNIFSRSRTKVVPVVNEIKQPVIVVPEQTYYTLRGITKQAEEFVSFVEDSRTMTVKKVRKGDRIGPGKAGDITLDDMSYVNGGKTISVKIGMTLEGRTSGSGGPNYSSGSNAFQGNRQVQSVGQAQAMGQGPGMGQAQGPGQAQGMGQNQGNSQFPGVGQAQGSGQFPAMGQAQSMPQPQGTGQVQLTGQSKTAGQTQPAVKAGSQTGQSDQSGGDVLQRLKERRKKELEE